MHSQTHSHIHTHTHVRHDGKMHVGKLYVYAVVGYREDGEDEEEGRTLFVQIRPYADDGIVKRDVTGSYTIKRKATKSERRKLWVHGSRLCMYMFKPKGTDKSPAERRKYVKLIPVAKAFVHD